MTIKTKIAIISLGVGVISFLNLFGIEKAVLAILLGYIALKEVSSEQKKANKFAIGGIILGAVYIVFLITIFILKGSKIIELFTKIK